jgi:RNA polymerase sigma-70 factor, ECF subfamily
VLSRDEADDVASETWLQVIRDLRGFAGGAEDFRRWLFTVARHRAIDAARATARRRTSPVPDNGLDLLADRRQVEDQVLGGMSVTAAVDLLAGLSADQAEAVALRVIADLDTPAAAAILGKSPGAIRVALHRGLRTLAADPAVLALAARDLAWDPARDGQASGHHRGGGPGAGAGFCAMEEVD